MTPEEYAAYSVLVGHIIEAALHATRTEQECLVALMYLCDLRDRQIARALGVNRQYAQRVRVRALQHMAEYLRARGYDVTVTPLRQRPAPAPKPPWRMQNKLTPETVRQVRLMAAQGVSLRAIARRYGVAKTTIRRAITRETWGYVQ